MLVCFNNVPARVPAAIAHLKAGRMQVAEIGQADQVPDGWWDASIVSKPVPITNLFTALFFLILKMVLGG